MELSICVPHTHYISSIDDVLFCIQPAEFKPVPLEQGDEYDYILALKQELRATMKKSPFYISSNEKRKDIERYSDKYQLGSDNIEEWTPGIRCLLCYTLSNPVCIVKM